MKKIRVGLIRCDSHGAYFGAMMGRHDPLKLRDPIERGTPPKKTWQAGGVHFYFYTSYWQPTLMTVPFAEGFEITRIWDHDADLASSLSAVFDSQPKVCDTVDAVSDDVDLVFIADCNGVGQDHLDLTDAVAKALEFMHEATVAAKE